MGSLFHGFTSGYLSPGSEILKYVHNAARGIKVIIIRLTFASAGISVRCA